ncbi:MAG: Chemotaxis signal receiving protein CheY [Cyanobacteria bacterium RYN_339]|nr:Chemotaxis signal receiving protein CheY [Cyanobacteria bacterium RYN_339]
MHRQPTVLIVDDLVFVRRMLKGLLRQQGFKCYEASSLSQALDSYHLFRPDLVIVGTLHSGMTSVIAIEALKRFDPRARVICCTEEATRSQVIASIRAGAEDFVARPFKQDRFFRAVQGQRPAPAPVEEEEIAPPTPITGYAPTELELIAF